jgi:hypothetical protein
MTKPRNAMEIFRILDHSNCRECGEKTCLAFAGAVYTGRKSLDHCPKIDPETLQRYTGKDSHGKEVENGAEYLDHLKEEIRHSNLAELAKKIGAHYADDRLTLKVLGKRFSVDSQGDLYADIHINPWVAGPFLNHVLYGKGVAPSGNWASLRELKDGQERYPLFRKRCEEPIQHLADSYPGFFDDMVHLFGGKEVPRQFQSSISVVLHPLPKIPIMICYWRPEDGLQSSLNLFFDTTATDNLDIGSLFSLGSGLAQMFVKLAQRHGAP